MGNIPHPRFADISGPVDALIVAGEHSGDQQAARMLDLHRARYGSPVRIAAMGGPALATSGAEVVFDMMEHAVVGAVEVIRYYPFFARLMKETIRWIGANRPRVICLVDYPGFNLRLAARIRQSFTGSYRPRVVFYISPQLWAWKGKRRFAMARHLDSLAVIFPFETEVYADTDLEVRYVGHPFADDLTRSPVRYEPEAPVLLLPGSRTAPVRRIMPILLEAYQGYRELGGKSPAATVCPDGRIHDLVTSILDRSGASGVTTQLIGDGVLQGRSVLTSSGTMSLHCALAGIPGAIVYRANPLTYWLGRRIVKVQWLGMANILLNRSAYPEFLQGEARPSDLARYLYRLEQEPAIAEDFQAVAHELRDLLRPPSSGDVCEWWEEQLNSAGQII